MSVDREWSTAFLDQGEALCLSGNQPFRLDHSDDAWLLEDGRVELFLLTLNAEGIESSRHHLASIHSGSLLLGMEVPEDTKLALLAVPHADTQLRRWTQTQLQQAANDALVTPALVPALEAWIRALSAGMARWVTPRPTIDQAISSRATLQLLKNQRCCGANTLAWLELPSDTVFYLDIQDLMSAGKTALLPLSADTWIVSMRALELSANSTAEVIKNGNVWQGIAQLHRLLFENAELNLHLANVDEYNRLSAREEANEQERDSAFAKLAAVLGKTKQSPTDRIKADQPLIQALNLIGGQVGFKLKIPEAHHSEEQLSLDEILRYNALQQRKVTLSEGFEQHDFGVLLVFDKETKQPLVLQFGSTNDPRLFDPATDAELDFALNQERLAQEAVEISPHLPFRSMGFRDLFGFALARNWRDLLMLLLMGALGGLLTLATPIATAYLVGSVIPDHDFSLLLQIGAGLAVLGITAGVVSYAGALAYSRLESRVGRVLQAGSMDRLLRLPMAFFQQFSAGDLVTRLLALSQIQTLISTASVSSILSGIFGLFGFAILFYYDMYLALWASLLTLVYIALSLLLAYLRLRREREVARITGTLASRLLQLVLGVTKIRLAAAEDRAFARWAKLFADSRRHQLEAQRIGAWQNALNQSLLLLGLLMFVLLIGEPSESGGLLAIGAFSALLIAFQNFAAGLTTTTMMMTQLIAVQPQLERARPILAAIPENNENRADPGLLTGAIEISHVSFRYQADTPLILQDISIQIAAGEFIALVGSSGSGKSTLLRLLMGFEQAQEGAILFDGQNLDGLDVAAVRRQMGVVMQNSQPMPMSLLELIVGISGGSEEDAWRAAKAVGLAEDIQQMPMEMQTLILEGGGALSGGQVQRLMIARAIVNRPKILVLDEATSALDNRTQDIVTQSLARTRVTRIVVAHRLSTIVDADRIYVLDAGRIVESGTYAELMAEKGAFARLAQRQLL